MFFHELGHEAQVRGGEAAEIREDVGHVGGVDAEPFGECGAVLIDAGGGDPAACAGVVGAVDLEDGELAVGAFAFDCAGAGAVAAEDDVVGAPAVVGALAVAGEGAPEVAGGEADDFVDEVAAAICAACDLLDAGLECADGFAEFVEQIGVGAEKWVAGVCGVADLGGVGVVAADGDEEDLPFDLEGVASGDEAGDHFELVAE